MGDEPHIAYQPRRDAKPETELSALASVYRHVLDCHAKNKAAEPHQPDAAVMRSLEGVSHVDRRTD